MAIMSDENKCFREVFWISYIISFAYYVSPLLIVPFDISHLSQIAAIFLGVFPVKVFCWR